MQITTKVQVIEWVTADQITVAVNKWLEDNPAPRGHVVYTAITREEDKHRGGYVYVAVLRIDRIES